MPSYYLLFYGRLTWSERDSASLQMTWPWHRTAFIEMTLAKAFWKEEAAMSSATMFAKWDFNMEFVQCDTSSDLLRGVNLSVTPVFGSIVVPAPQWLRPVSDWQIGCSLSL